MRSTAVTALILQLLFALGHSEFEFGDILSMSADRTCGIPISKHYAVYVGDEPFEGKLPGQKIFHRLMGGPDKCIFSSLKSSYRKATEYDVKSSETTKPLMIERIKALRRNCGVYDQETNNCEQVATYVRYKEKLLLQKGTAIRALLFLCPGGVSERCQKYKEMMSNAAAELKGWKEAEKKGCKISVADPNNN